VTVSEMLEDLPSSNPRSHIPKLKERNVRTGFYEYPDFVALRDALPEYLRPVFLMGYFTGMREGEILGLTWSKVNIFARKITLNPSDTKNGEPRIIYLIEEEIYEAIKGLKMLHDRLYRDCPYVFCKDGRKIVDFRPDWNRALRECGYPIMFKCKDCKQATELPSGTNRKDLSCGHCGGTRLRKNSVRVFHDTRRTAVRNLSRSGTPEKIAMAITGHKTRAIFDRYNIVNEDDLKAASARLARQHQETKLLHEQPVSEALETEAIGRVS
jgi:integrase